MNNHHTAADNKSGQKNQIKKQRNGKLMKKLLALFLCTAAAGAIMTGCSASDGDVDNGNGAGAGTSTTMNDRTDSYDRNDRNDSYNTNRTVTTRREISDDIADGINDGLDKTQSVVDDILK